MGVLDSLKTVLTHVAVQGAAVMIITVRHDYFLCGITNRWSDHGITRQIEDDGILVFRAQM